MKHPMSLAQANKVQRYIWAVRAKLRLQHWDVYPAADAAGDGQKARIEPCEGRLTAPIFLAVDFFDDSPDEIRNTITHELLHLFHRDQVDVVRKVIPESGLIPQATFDMIWEAFRLQTEQMVDHLTQVLCKYMPEWKP